MDMDFIFTPYFSDLNIPSMYFTVYPPKVSGTVILLEVPTYAVTVAPSLFMKYLKSFSIPKVPFLFDLSFFVSFDFVVFLSALFDLVNFTFSLISVSSFVFARIFVPGPTDITIIKDTKRSEQLFINFFFISIISSKICNFDHVI